VPSTSHSSSSTSSSELLQVRRLLARAALFAAPFCLYALFMLFADPFDFIGAPSLVPEEVKARTASQLNPCFWKMRQFERDPAANILLGDSRMNAISADKLRELTGEDYYNFGYGGGSLQEAVDTFWFAAERVKLRRVYIGLHLSTYNDYNYTERTKLYETVARNPALYFVNRTVLQAALYDTYSHFAGTDLRLGAPTVDREAFWRDYLDNVLGGYYSNYVHPERYQRELTRIARYCRENGVELTFVIFPSHVEAQRRIRDFHLERESLAFRRDLASLATTYDFDYENEITTRRENYTDPVHTVRPVNELLMSEIWLDQPRIGRKYGPLMPPPEG
jgi:hypothetical protein